MWATIKNGIGAIFSSQKIVDGAASLISSVPAGIDAIWETEEEKATDKKERYGLWLKAQALLQNEQSAFSLVRRAIAIITNLFFFGCLVVAGMMQIIALFFDPVQTISMASTSGDLITMASKYAQIVGASSYFKQLAVDSYELVLMVNGFYFGPGIVRSFRKGE